MNSETLKILEKATELFFSLGIKSVSMDDLARHLGISKKTLYQSIENKEDLISKALFAHIEGSSKQIEEIFNNPNNNAIDVLTKVASVNSQILRKINPAAIYDLKKYYHNIWKKLQEHEETYISEMIERNIKEGIEQGLYRDNINVSIITKLYASQIDFLTDQEKFPQEQFSISKVYIEFIRYHIYGIASPKGIKYFNKILQDIKEQRGVA